MTGTDLWENSNVTALEGNFELEVYENITKPKKKYISQYYR